MECVETAGGMGAAWLPGRAVSPTYGGVTPTYENVAPTGSAVAPTGSGAAPTYENVAPTYSGAAPTYGGAAPTYEKIAAQVAYAGVCSLPTALAGLLSVAQIVHPARSGHPAVWVAERPFTILTNRVVLLSTAAPPGPITPSAQGGGMTSALAAVSAASLARLRSITKE